VGGLGVAPGANIGQDLAIFEPVHGSAPTIAGKDIANPTAMMLSGVQMLRYIGELEAADRMQKAITKVLEQGTVTSDLGGKLGTAAFTEKVISVLD
jgi:isocitrate dehydrogenase (NAD+)